MATRDEIQVEVANTLVQIFDVPAEKVRPETRLIEDLGLDSLDAIDMAVQLEQRVGYEFKGPELRAIRTVDDIVELIATNKCRPLDGAGARAE